MDPTVAAQAWQMVQGLAMMVPHRIDRVNIRGGRSRFSRVHDQEEKCKPHCQGAVDDPLGSELPRRCGPHRLGLTESVEVGG